ncbi:MAG: hypothetical protein JKP98_12090 [Rhodobacteraceae bacterium]|nr:hypothetical protein [Paracoccaceae bacterium]
MTTAIAITYFGTRLAVRGFPDIEAVESVFDTADLQRDSDFQNAPKLWRAMLQLHREGPGAGRTPPPVYPGAQPEQARALVEAMTRALLLAMIVALVVVSLALDWIILRAEPGATLEAGLRLAAQAWLYLLGAGFSLALGLSISGQACGSIPMSTPIARGANCSNRTRPTVPRLCVRRRAAAVDRLGRNHPTRALCVPSGRSSCRDR